MNVEVEWLAGLRRRDAAVYESLVSRYEGPLYRYFLAAQRRSAERIQAHHHPKTLKAFSVRSFCSSGHAGFLDSNSLTSYSVFDCALVATPITASKAGFGLFSPSNNSGVPNRRQETASLAPQNVTIFTLSRCLTNARKIPA
jgi:hypothetical protein